MLSVKSFFRKEQSAVSFPTALKKKCVFPLFADIGGVRNVYTPSADDRISIHTFESVFTVQVVSGDGGNGACHTVRVLLNGTGHGTGIDSRFGGIGCVNAEYRNGLAAAVVVAGALQTGDRAECHFVVIGDDKLDHVVAGFTVLGKNGGHIFGSRL